MALTFDHDQFLINAVDQDTVVGQSLIDAIKQHEASEEGIWYPEIATASGKEDLDAGVAVGLTIQLNPPWQLKFPEGPYIAKIVGCNLVGGLDGDPIAYSAGVQVLWVMSASSTIVTASGVFPTVNEIAIAVWDYLKTKLSEVAAAVWSYER